MSSAIEQNRTHQKGKKSIERSIFELMISVKQALNLESSNYFSLECYARVLCKRRNSAEMASDALGRKLQCVVKGYQECRFDVKDGEVFKVLKKIGEVKAVLPNCKQTRTIRSPST